MDHLEGYKDEGARDESRAWVAPLEGTVQAALVCDISFLMPCPPTALSHTESFSLSSFLRSEPKTRRQHVQLRQC
jgi:hypothetical protein